MRFLNVKSSLILIDYKLPYRHSSSGRIFVCGINNYYNHGSLYISGTNKKSYCKIVTKYLTYFHISQIVSGKGSFIKSYFELPKDC